MDKLLSKISLYDILTTVVTGYILCISMRHGLLEDYISEPLSSFITTIPRKIVVASIVGLVFHKVVEFLTQFNFANHKFSCSCVMAMSTLVSRNNLSIIKQAQKELNKEIPEAGNTVNNMKDYYDAYYCLWQKGNLGVIPTLEAHSAFIKDLFFAIMIGIILFVTEIEIYVTAVSAVIAVVVFSIARYQCEKKIYRLILEEYFYEQK